MESVKVVGYRIIIVLLVIFSFVNFWNVKASNSDYLPDDVMEIWEGGPAYYDKWTNGPSSDLNFFPIAVWYQNPNSGYFYQKMGVNFINYWGSVANAKESDLGTLKKYGMSGVTAYTTVYANSTNCSIIKAWMHEKDEPDNAVSGTQNPVSPSTIINDYNAMKAIDPTRPVFISLGKGAAINSWYGRGNRTNHPEDYIEYAKGADIMTFDVYPMNTPAWTSDYASWKYTHLTELSGNIWYVAKGVDNLRKAADYKKPVWAWIECTNFNADPNCKLTPAITRSEVWMALIHGARGVGYFCHIFSPTLVQAGVLNDAAMKAEITAINAQITANAPVLNTQSVSNGATVLSSNTAIPVDFMVKRFNGFTYIYAISMRSGSTDATFTLRDFVGTSNIEVVGENRQLAATNGVFNDNFSDYSMHIYKVATPINNPIRSVEKNQHNLQIVVDNSQDILSFKCDEYIDRADVYSLSGQKITSCDVNDYKGDISLGNISQKMLILKFFIQEDILLCKFIMSNNSL
ncbi:MAG: hypothetical protein ABFC90_02205 [Bacteroidales bacterium]|nr:hypothetical protein [Bacteroidales bacterium]